MRIAGIIKNDFSAAQGVCLSVFVQGCPIKCKGCHNPEAQSFSGGKEYTPKIERDILEGLQANGIKRSLCIMGGEPLCYDNLELTRYLIDTVKSHYPETKIYIWTGYLYEDLLKPSNISYLYQHIFQTADYLIDGPYIDSERDITLKMRGSRNQRIIDLRTGEDVTNVF